MKKIIIAYVPVLHEGYRRFFEKYSSDAKLCIFGQELIERFDYLYKEIRALDPELILRSIQSWGMFDEVEILDFEKLKKLKSQKIEIIIPKEDVAESLVEEYFSDKKIRRDDIFLRWDKHNYTNKNKISSNLKISQDNFDKKIMKLVFSEAEKSSDWWRNVGAVIIKNNKVLLSGWNKHVPSEHTPYANGDPRNGAHKGMNLDLSTSLHAEAGIIAEAAKKGISLEGSEMYVTTFPCPPCAKQIAYSGIKKLYFCEGYGILDGESILKSKGVEIVQVMMDRKKEKRLGDVEYKKIKNK